MQAKELFSFLNQVTSRPELFEVYNAEMLWDDEHISKQLLGLHLDPSVEMVSRRIDVIERSVQWLVSSLNIGAQTAIADIGCGPGLYANRLARYSDRVTGVDISRRSIDYARKTARHKNLTARYVRQNYFEFTSSQKFDLIFLIYCDFCSFSLRLQRIFLQKIYNMLVDDGALVLDVYTLNQFNHRKESADYEHVRQGGFWSAGEYFGFLKTFKYDAAKVTLDKYTLIEKDRVRTFYNWCQHFSRKSLSSLFEAYNFKIEACYADLTGRPYKDDSTELAIVARKA